MNGLSGTSRRVSTSLLGVWLNGVRVGTITEGEYAQMRQVARRDPRNAAAQTLNLAHVFAGIAWRMALGVPLALFWTVASYAVFAPSEFGGLVQAFAGAMNDAASADAVVCAVQDAMAGASVIAALALLAWVVVDPTRLGAKNCYGADVDRLLRLHCRTPVEGRVSVRRAIAACGDSAVLVL